MQTILDSATTAGLLLFGRYAFPPNRFGYCGSDDHASLFAYITGEEVDGGLAELARKFEGAYPYLKLIAGANNIRDPFDPRVVEAYWLGNDYLERVAPSAFYDSLKERFAARMTNHAFSWLATGLESGSKPHHNFHVFDVYRRAGLVRDGHATIALDRMDQCRISWGRVLLVEEAAVVVQRSPLEVRSGKIALGSPQPVRLLRRIDGRGYAEGLEVGDVVSLHWDWVCERLTATKMRRLVANTRRAIANTNLTL